MKRHSLFATMAFCVAALAAPPASANSPDEVAIDHALTVGVAGGVTSVTPIVTYDYELLSGRFARSGDVFVTLKYHLRRGVSSITVQSRARLDPADSIAYLPPVELTMIDDLGEVAYEVVASMGGDSVSLAYLSLFFERQPSGDGLLLSGAEWVDRHRSARPQTAAEARMDLEPGDVPGEGKTLPGRQRPNCAVDVCMNE